MMTRPGRVRIGPGIRRRRLQPGDGGGLLLQHLQIPRINIEFLKVRSPLPSHISATEPPPKSVPLCGDLTHKAHNQGYRAPLLSTDLLHPK
jgi:hypothetical protein